MIETLLLNYHIYTSYVFKAKIRNGSIFLDPPENVMLKLTRCGDSATIKCSAEAQPSASFKIFFNETELVSTNKTFTIPEVNVSHFGNYSCVAKNILGTKTSNSEYLFFIEGK